MREFKVQRESLMLVVDATFLKKTAVVRFVKNNLVVSSV